MEHHAELRGRALAFLSLLWFLWFINIGARAIFAPILPLIEDEFIVSHARASSIFALQSIGCAFALFFSGIYSGRLGYKKCIALSLAISSGVFFSIPFVKVFSTLSICSFILGFSVGTYLPSALPLITEYFAEKHWGKSIAIHDSAASVSIFCIPFIVLFLLHFFAWRGVFIVMAVVFLMSAVAFFFASDELKITHSQKTIRGDLLRRRALWIMGTLWIFASGAYWGIYFTIPLFLTKELSLDIGYANTVLGISRLGGIVVAIMCGLLVDRFSLRKITFSMLLLTGLFTILVGVASVRFMAICLSFQVIFVTGFFPMGLVSVAKMFDRETRGMATGFILIFSLLLGSGLIPYLLGLSGDLVGFRFGIVLLGIMVTASSPLLFYLKELK
jgi:MFS transporter, NNP family, nitrate/nitrite transporter